MASDAKSNGCCAACRGLAPRRLRLSLRSAGSLSSRTLTHRQRPAWVYALREGGNASFEALNKAFLYAKHRKRKNFRRLILIERRGKKYRSSASQQMPDAGLACVASFAVSENTSARRRGAALFPGKVQFFERPLLNCFLRISLNNLDFPC